MLLKVETDGVVRFLNTDYIVSAKYHMWEEEPHMVVSTTTGELDLDGDLAVSTKAALETALYLQGRGSKMTNRDRLKDAPDELETLRG